MPVGRFWRTIRVKPATETIPQDVEAELRFHLESRAEDLMRAGVSREAAREQALREFGDVSAARLELERMDRRRVARQARSRWWFDVLGDLRFAFRTLARHRGFTLAGLLTLALGTGANPAIYSVLHTALLRPLPYREPQQLVHLWETHGEGGVATNQGLAKGGAQFSRLEGCWYGDQSIFFNATSGGDAGAGQVWQYIPAREEWCWCSSHSARRCSTVPTTSPLVPAAAS